MNICLGIFEKQMYNWSYKEDVGPQGFLIFFTTTLSLDSGCLYSPTLSGLTELPGQVAGDGQTLCQLLFANL